MTEFPRWNKPENHPANQSKYSPAMAAWLYGRNGIPGIRMSMTRDPGCWGRYCDPDGGIVRGVSGGVNVYDLDFSKSTNSFYFGIV